MAETMKKTDMPSTPTSILLLNSFNKMLPMGKICPEPKTAKVVETDPTEKKLDLAEAHKADLRSARVIAQ